MEFQIISILAPKESITIEDGYTIGEVRGLVCAILDVPEDKKLIMSYKGKQLINDEEIFFERMNLIDNGSSTGNRKLFCNIRERNGQEISVEAMKANLPSQKLRKEQENEERKQASMMEPLIESIANNPGFIESVMKSQPDFQNALKGHPEIARMMKDPETIKELMMSQLDPDRRREMSLSLRSSLAQIEAMPGGVQMLERYTGDLGKELELTTKKTHDDLYEVSDEQARPNPLQECNAESLENPWTSPAQTERNSNSNNLNNTGGMFSPEMMQMAMQMMSGSASNGASREQGASSMFPGTANTMGGMFSPEMMQIAMQMMSGSAPNSTSSAQLSEAELRTRYAEQLAILQGMGFDDESKCLRLLRQFNGDVEAVVDYIAENE